MPRKLTAVLLVVLLVAGVLPATAQGDTYTLFLTDDDSFGFVYPADWEYSIDADVGSVNLAFDAGIMFVYMPDTVAALAGTISDPVKFLTILAGEVGATADDITDLDPGAALMTLEEDSGVTYIRQLVAMPLSNGDLGLIQLYVEIDQFDDYIDAFLVISLTMDVYAPGAAPGPGDVEAMLTALGIEGSVGGGGGGGDLVLSSFGGDYQRTIAALRDLDLIPPGGSLLFTEDYAYFTGQGSFYTPLARNSARTNFVMSGELNYEPSGAADLETCTLGMRVTWSGNSATAYMDVGYTSAGTVYYLDLPAGADPTFDEVDPGVSVLVPHTFTIIVLDDMITVFMDDTLMFQDMPVEARSGTWGVGLEGKGTGALCEARDIWVFQLDS